MTTYQYICKKCNGIFTTTDIGLPLCRPCWGSTGLSRTILFEMFGYPKPSPLQEVKNGNGIRWRNKIKEQHRRLRREVL